MRAHLAGHRVRDARIDDDGAIWIVADGGDGIARLALRPGRGGEAEVLAPDGRVVAHAGRASGDDARARGETRWTDAYDPEAIGRAMLDDSERVAAEHSRARLERAVRRQLHAIERRADAVRGDLARLDEVRTLQKIGRLLLTQSNTVPRGASRALLHDDETGEGIEVLLDPARPARAQAEGFFAKARRWQRGAAVMRKRLDDAEASARELHALLEAMASDATAVLEPFAARARSLGVRDAGAREEAGSRTKADGSHRREERRPYLRFRGARGAVVMVGRGGRDNDTLTTRHARPHDLWLHARGVSGAHVVVPLEKGTSCPADLLVDAATLTAHFSDARGAAFCEVTYVQRRYVRKPRGAAPGAVVFDHEKVLALRLEPERLARLLATREG
jgi:predicted ribosome quality control (RQC) complex YloA/Tae2 family protein